MMPEIRISSQSLGIEEQKALGPVGDLSDREVVIAGGDSECDAVVSGVARRTFTEWLSHLWQRIVSWVKGFFVGRKVEVITKNDSESLSIDPEEHLGGLIVEGFQPLLMTMQQQFGGETTIGTTLNMLNQLASTVRWDDDGESIIEMDAWLSLQCQQIVEVSINKMVKSKKLQKFLDEKKVDIEQLRVRGQELMSQHVAKVLKALEEQTKMIIGEVIAGHTERLGSIREAVAAVDNAACVRMLTARIAGWQELSKGLLEASASQDVIMTALMSLQMKSMEDSYLGIIEEQPQRAYKEYLKDFCKEMREGMQQLKELLKETPLVAVIDAVDEALEESVDEDKELQAGLIMQQLINNIEKHYADEHLKEAGPVLQELVKRLSEIFKGTSLEEIFEKADKALEEVVANQQFDNMLSIQQQLMMFLIKHYQEGEQQDEAFRKKLEEALPLFQELIVEGRKHEQVVPEDLSKAIMEGIAPSLRKFHSFVADQEILEAELAEYRARLERIQDLLVGVGNKACAKVITARLIAGQELLEQLRETRAPNERVKMALMIKNMMALESRSLYMMEEQPERPYEEHVRDYSAPLLSAVQRMGEVLGGTPLASAIKPLHDTLEKVITEGKFIETFGLVQQLVGVVHGYYEEEQKKPVPEDFEKLVNDEVVPNLEKLPMFLMADEIIKQDLRRQDVDKHPELVEMLEKRMKGERSPMLEMALNPEMAHHVRTMQERHEALDKHLELLKAVKEDLGQDEYRGHVERFLEGWNQRIRMLQTVKDIKDVMQCWDREDLSGRIEGEEAVLDMMRQQPEASLREQMLATAQKLRDEVSGVIEEIRSNEEYMMQINENRSWWDYLWNFGEFPHHEPTVITHYPDWARDVHRRINQGFRDHPPEKLAASIDEGLRLARIVRCLAE